MSASTPPPIHRKLESREWILALIIVVIVVGVAAPFWNMPLNRDQGVYATCAEILLAGGAPFSDCWDTKGPALHTTYALARLIFGYNTAGPYILNTLAIAATSIVLANLTLRFLNARLPLAYGVGLLYGLLAISVRFDMNAQPESFANLFALLGVLGMTTAVQEKKLWLFPISGAVLAFTMLYKYALLLPYGMLALALVALIPLNSAENPFRERLRIFGLTIAGSLGLILAFSLYLLARGALDDAILHLRFIFFYFPKAQLNPDEFALRSEPVVQTLQYFGRLPVIIAFGLAGAGWATGKRRWIGPLLISAIVAAIAVVWGQQRFTPYHWTAGLPILALGIGTLAHEVINWARLSQRAQSLLLTGITVAILTNVAIFFYQDQWLIVGDYITGREDMEAFFESQGVWDHKVAGDYLRDHTDPDDAIWVWGHHTAIYYLAQRHSPTRFIYNEPLLMHIRGGHPWKDTWREDTLNDIYNDPPKYILLTTFDRTYFDFQNPNDAWRDIPVYNAFTAQHYVKEYEFGRFQFWRLNPYWSRLNNSELLDGVTIINLSNEISNTDVIFENDPPVRIETFWMPAEEPYDAILMQPQSEIVYLLDLPEDVVCLRADLGMYPDSWTWGGDGASFAVQLETETETVTLLEEYISNDTDDQRWHPVLLDLGDYSGETVRLHLITGPGPNGDFTGDWAGWGTPRIVKPPSGDTCDTNAIIDTR